jgi:hypothetical protein
MSSSTGASSRKAAPRKNRYFILRAAGDLTIAQLHLCTALHHLFTGKVSELPVELLKENAQGVLIIS